MQGLMNQEGNSKQNTFAVNDKQQIRGRTHSGNILRKHSAECRLVTQMQAHRQVIRNNKIQLYGKNTKFIYTLDTVIQSFISLPYLIDNLLVE